MGRTTPSYAGLSSASTKASRAARGSSKKSGTKPELILSRALWSHGCRFRRNLKSLPGKPDIVFTKARLIVFCDGDFWHGNDWPKRREKLSRGHNADYWIAKIERNMERDLLRTTRLEQDGWTVLRFWESEIRQRPDEIVREVLTLLDARGHRRLTRRTESDKIET